MKGKDESYREGEYMDGKKKAVLGIVVIVIFILAGITMYRWYFKKSDGLCATGTVEVTRVDRAQG